MNENLLDEDLLYQETDARSVTDLINNGYETDVTGYINRGFKLFFRDPGSYIAYLIVYIILAVALGLIMTFIPFGNVLSSIVMMPLFMGAIIVAKMLDKGESYSFSNFFDGYKYFGEIAIASLIRIGVVILLAVVCLIPFGMKAIFNLANFEEVMQDPITIIQTLAIPIFILIALYIIIFTFWLFAFMFIVFPKFKAWPALEASRKIISKRFFNWFGFCILLILVNFMGMLLFGIGLLITIPASICAMYLAFDEVCGVNIRP